MQMCNVQWKNLGGCAVNLVAHLFNTVDIVLCIFTRAKRNDRYFKRAQNFPSEFFNGSALPQSRQSTTN